MNATNETTAKLHNESTPALADELSDLAPICDKRDPQCDRAATWYVTARCPIDGCRPRVWLACDYHFAGIDRRRKYRCGNGVFTLADAITGTGRIGGAQ